MEQAKQKRNCDNETNSNGGTNVKEMKLKQKRNLRQNHFLQNRNKCI